MKKKELINKWKKEIASFELAANNEELSMSQRKQASHYYAAISDCLEDLKQLKCSDTAGGN